MVTRSGPLCDQVTNERAFEMAKTNKNKILLSEMDTETAASMGSELILRHPVTDEELRDEDGPVAITLYGADSKKFKAAASAIAEANQRKKRKVTTLAVQEQNAVKVLAAVTMGWSNMCLDEAGALEFNRQNVIDVYTKFSWIREQVDEFIADRSNFLQAAPTN